MRRSSLGLFLATAAAAYAQAPGKPASVEGMVTHALTGAPIQRVHVTLDGFNGFRQQQYGASTDAEGKFSIAGVPPGNYALGAERPGFVPLTDNRSMSLAIKAGDTKTDLKLTLTPTGGLVGRVLDADGNAVGGATVRAEGPIPRTEVTDDRGRYRIGGLAPGRYRVRASIPNNMPPEIRTDGSMEEYHAPTEYPGRVAVGAGVDIEGIDIRLERSPIVRISGVIAGIPAGAQPRDLGVELHGEDHSRRWFTGFAGPFEMWKIDPGKWWISAVCAAGGVMLRSAPVEVVVGRTNVDGIELRLMTPFDVSGRVELEDGITGKAPPASARLWLTGTAPPTPRQLAAIGPDGSFRFKAVYPARYRVVPEWRPATVTSIQLGPTRIDGSVLDLSLGGASDLTVVLTSATGEISGTVSDEKGPAAGVRIALVGGSNRLFATSDAAGAYRLTDIRPGTYKLAATDSHDPVTDEADLEAYEDAVVTVEVRPGDRRTQDLKRRTRP